MSNRKGQMGMGIVIVAFIGIICALILFQTISQYVGTSAMATAGSANYTTTVPAANSSIDLLGQELVGAVTFLNGSNASHSIAAANFTVREGVDSTGVKGIILTSGDNKFQGTSVNVLYSYYPDGYIDDAGGRGIALIIPILAALAIAVIALAPTLKSGIMDMMK